MEQLASHCDVNMKVGTNSGFLIGANRGVINNNFTRYTDEGIDRDCLHALQCPDVQIVKTRLQENKDKLLHRSYEWILQDPQYGSWRDGDDICLLWINGGAGKGKTMMSIGLIERLALPQDGTTIVTYFFCQNADSQLNTIEAIIKGLVLELVKQQKELMQFLRSRWDSENKRFDQDITWRVLWDVLVEMLRHCKCRRAYVVVDALDECQDEGMAIFLRLIVRTGLSQPSKIKWLLTSRPLDSAKQELAGSDQVQVRFELNSNHISKAVKVYIASKVAELSRHHNYGEALCQKLEAELTKKAEDTFLWVSLVCKRLESVPSNKVLATIQESPSGLHPLYHRMLDQLSKGKQAVVEGCMRLLKAILLTYRPLNIAEVASVTGRSVEEKDLQVLVDRCASFVKNRGAYIEFVHQSARDYLGEKNGQSLLDSYDYYGHYDIGLNCLSHLSTQLKINLADLPRPDSTWKSVDDKKINTLVASMDYAATFWVHHLSSVDRITLLQGALADHGDVVMFLRSKLLEWLECLSLLDKLPFAIDALTTLANIADPEKNPFLSTLVQDAMKFLLRHYQTLVIWPLQTYSSAVVFSPQTSIVKRENLCKVPGWLRKIPQVEDTWASLIKTLAGHSSEVLAVVFSPDGKHIASGSYDRTIKLWDATTGELQNTLNRHSFSVSAVAFSPDSKHIASGSYDRTIKLWDATTGELQNTLNGHSESVSVVAFSPDGKHIASGSYDKTIKLWDATTGELQKTLAGHSIEVLALVFSPDGKHIASGSYNRTIKLWDATTGELQNTLNGHSESISAVAFSPDGKHIASGSQDKTIKLWDATTGELQNTLNGHSAGILAVAFSPDSKHIASGSYDRTIKLWDATTGELQKILAGHSSLVLAVVFSPDGKHIASGSYDRTIKLWDATKGELQKTPVGYNTTFRSAAVALSPDGKHMSVSNDRTIKLGDTTTGTLKETQVSQSSRVMLVAYSPDGKHIASSSGDWTIKLWNATTGELQKTLEVITTNFMRKHLIMPVDDVLAFSPDGKHIASGSYDRTIKLWDATTGELQKTLAGHSIEVLALVFSPDGKHIASGSYDRTIKLWDATTGELQNTLNGHSDSVSAVAFSPDGKHIASGSYDKTIKLWDAMIGKLQKTLVGHSSRVLVVAFSPDGKHIASGSHDKTIKLWNTNTCLKGSRRLGGILGSSSKFSEYEEVSTSASVTTLKFSPDGRYFMTNLGAIKVPQSTGLDSLDEIDVQKQWIRYGTTPVLHLPVDFQATCHDVRSDQVAIGLQNGQVLCFDIDRRGLHSMLGRI